MNEFLQRVPSGVLDVLVQEIATTLGASAVFVTAEVASSGQTLLAEFPKSIAASTGLRDFSAAEGCGQRWIDSCMNLGSGYVPTQP